MIDSEILNKIHVLFKACSPVFLGIGDEVRQKLIMDIADAGENGINVTNLSAKTNLSRPAISHHLKVLKDCGIIKPTKSGTQIFYEIDMMGQLDNIIELVNTIRPVLENRKIKD